MFCFVFLRLFTLSALQLVIIGEDEEFGGTESPLILPTVCGIQILTKTVKQTLNMMLILACLEKNVCM